MWETRCSPPKPMRLRAAASYRRSWWVSSPAARSPSRHPAPTITEVINRINATIDGGVAISIGSALEIASSSFGQASSVVIGAGTANAILGFTDGETGQGAFADVTVTLAGQF